MLVDLPLNLIRARLLLRRAKRLLKCNSYDEALSDLQTIDHLCRVTTRTGLRRIGADAKLQSAIVLEMQGRLNEALFTYDQILTDFGNYSDQTIQLTVADALAYKAENLRRRLRVIDEMAAYDEIVRRYSCNFGHALKEKALWALSQKASRLGAQNLWDEEQEAVEYLLQLLDTHPRA